MSVVKPNRGDNPCVCGAIHPCCRFLVDGGCPHSTFGDHHHAPNRINTNTYTSGLRGAAVPLTREQKLERAFGEIRALADSWAVDDDTYLHMESSQELGYADAAVQINAILDRLT